MSKPGRRTPLSPSLAGFCPPSRGLRGHRGAPCGPAALVSSGWTPSHCSSPRALVAIEAVVAGEAGAPGALKTPEASGPRGAASRCQASVRSCRCRRGPRVTRRVAAGDACAEPVASLVEGAGPRCWPGELPSAQGASSEPGEGDAGWCSAFRECGVCAPGRGLRRAPERPFRGRVGDSWALRGPMEACRPVSA